MRSRPVIALSATLALLGGGSAIGSVGERADGPPVGASSTSLTLLDVGLGGKSLSVLELALRSDTLAGAPSTSFVVTPLAYDGTTYGRQSVSSRSAGLPAADSARLAPAALSALAAARSPRVDVTTEGGSSRAGTTSLGGISVLGMPLTLDGEISLASVVDGAGASGGKTLRVTELALPSVADLVAALGLDVKALPAGSLTDLLSSLNLHSRLSGAAQAELEKVLSQVPQLAPAQAAVVEVDQQVQAALAELDAASAALAPATAVLNDATRAVTGTTGLVRRSSLIGLDPAPVTTTVEPVDTSVPPVSTEPAPSLPVSTEPAPVVTEPAPSLPVPSTDPVTEPATVPVQDPVPPVVTAPTGTVDGTLGTVTAPAVTPAVTAPTLPEVLPLPTLPAEIPLSLQPAADAYTAAKHAYDDALQAVRDAEAALAVVTTTLEQALATVDALLAPYQAQVDALVDAVVGVLDATPLLSLDRLEVTTRSHVTSAGPGGQSADVIGGEVQGLRVLGTDVLQGALGSSTVEVLDLVGPVQTKVDSAIAGLTGTLSTVLSQVPGLPALEVPAPKVELLTRATSTDVVDGFGVAGSALRAVSVSWPGLTIPAAAALPGAAALPAVAGVPTLPVLPTLRSGSLVTAAGDVLTQPLSLSLATLEDRARFRPGQLSLQPGSTAPGTAAGAPSSEVPATGTPTAATPASDAATATGAGAPTAGTTTTGTPATGPAADQAPVTVATGQQLPRTGLDSAPSALALLLVAAALGLHRRRRTA